MGDAFYVPFILSWFPDIGSVGRIDKKKKNLKTNSQEVLEQDALAPQDVVKS